MLVCTARENIRTFGIFSLHFQEETWSIKSFYFSIFELNRRNVNTEFSYYTLISHAFSL